MNSSLSHEEGKKEQARVAILSFANQMLERVLTVFSNLCMLVVVVVVGAGVFYRYVLNDSPMWVDSFASLLFAVLVFTGSPPMTLRREQIVARFFVDSLSPRAQILIEAACDILIVIFSAMFAYSAYIYVGLELHTLMVGVAFPVSVFYSSMLVFGIATIMFATENLITGLRGVKKEGKPNW